ncbi:MAG: zinc-ribbon domain-containing protein [Holosporales bacterium]|jgi:hypothetical protein|nr:zinc-ribbon domain-containing protein [Holosporales bacterium]
MKIECPYCGCGYDINMDSLPKPMGDIRLGYGWWLRCCKCQKKWWLKNTYIQSMVNSPLKADVSDKINKLSKLKNKPKTKKFKLKYILLCTLIIVGGGIGFYYKDTFKSYIVHKIEKLFSNMASHLKMLNVQYFIDKSLTSSDSDTVSITINGNILNEDRNVVKLKGIRVTIYNEDGNNISSWEQAIGSGYIMSGETLEFSTKKDIKLPEGQIRVDVSIL